MKYMPLLAFAVVLSCARGERDNPFDAGGSNWSPPVVTALTDTTVSIHDSIDITALATDYGNIVKYVWAEGGAVYSDTTLTGSLKVAYSDTGKKVVRVKAIDGDGVESASRSCIVRVTLDPPVVTAMDDTSIYINDTTTIRANAVDNGTVWSYFWALDGVNYRDTTVAGTTRAVFADSGAHSVRVKVVDDDGVYSAVDAVVIAVKLGAPMVMARSDTTVYINDSIMVTATAVDNGAVVKYAWAKDGLTYADTTTSGVLKVAFSTSGRKVVCVKAIDDDDVWSAPDSCVLTVSLGAPVVTAMASGIVNIKDSITITATATDNGTVVKYLWAKDGASYNDTTTTCSLRVAYPDSGRKVVRVKAKDDDGVISLPDSCIVTVTWGAPVVAAMADTSVYINDTMTIRATAVDNGAVVKYAWARDGSTYTDTTPSGVLKVAFSTSGRKVVRVKAIDDDDVWSAPDSCVLTVALGAPVVTAHSDTMVSFARSASVTVNVKARDENPGGCIVKYFWDIGANGWDDSTSDSSYAVTSDYGGPVTVRWAARDDDGVASADTFSIVFSRPPGNASVTAPTTNTGWVDFSHATGKGTLPLTLTATDPDGGSDTLTYTLFIGPSASALTQAYSGKLMRFNAPNIDSNATVYWHLQVRDLCGDSAVAAGAIAAPPPPPPAGMKLIAGGTFQMGSAATPPEQPIHSVTLSSFWMDSTEVTRADYLRLMGVNSSYFTGRPNNSVDMVTWFDAVLYCNERSKRDGWDTVYAYTSVTGTPGNGCTALSSLTISMTTNGYRLPTEAQWEYACRAGTTMDYYWGVGTIDDYAWYVGDSGDSAHPVAEKLPNAFGLYDMSGNVMEWTNDWYGPYVSGAATEPTGAGSGTARVNRGGSWGDTVWYLRSADRHQGSSYSRATGVGFRVVRPAR